MVECRNVHTSSTVVVYTEVDEERCLDKSTDDTELTVASSSSSIGLDEYDAKPQSPRNTEIKSVGFSSIEIREYDQIIGDQTDLIGPPLSIGWIYSQRQPMPLFKYEENRPPRRPQMEILITPTGRRQMLMNNWGYTSEEICNEERSLVKLREKEGRETCRIDGVMQKMRKKVKRVLSSISAAAISSGNSFSPANQFCMVAFLGA
mmetsp:Transcript_24057/g.70947  ORF Transcript_24057/g.70947 Transcript_24057/m.70947 type:complete len:205 (-) Transcript_24057:32-646(-)